MSKEDAPTGTKKKTIGELRSQRWFASDDIRGFAHRQRMQQQGLAREEFMGRPVIGIINTWSELSPCHAHLRERAEAVKRGAELQVAEAKFDEANMKAQELEKQAAASQKKADDASTQAGKVAAQLYRTGGRNLTATLFLSGNGASGTNTHSPRLSAETWPSSCPPSRSKTVAPGSARPAITVSPLGLIRTTSKPGRPSDAAMRATGCARSMQTSSPPPRRGLAGR